jgi:hypothetical protein
MLPRAHTLVIAAAAVLLAAAPAAASDGVPTPNPALAAALKAAQDAGSPCTYTYDESDPCWNGGQAEANGEDGEQEGPDVEPDPSPSPSPSPTPAPGTQAVAPSVKLTRSAPTRVVVDFQMINLRLVDARASNFVVTGLLFYTWRNDSVTPKRSGANIAANAIPWWPNHVWSNRLTVAEANAQFVIRPGPPKWAGVDPAATSTNVGKSTSTEWWIEYQVEVQVTFLQAMNLREFPYDVQPVLMQLESRTHSVQNMFFTFAPGAQGDLNPQLGQPDGFNITGAITRTDTNFYSKIGFTTSRANFGLRLQRDPSFFVSSFVQPLSLTMCITIFTISLMPVGQVGPRNAAVSGGIGTTVSWVFTVSNMVPVLPYPTRLHSFLRFCFFVFAAIWVYNSWAFIMLDRYKATIENSRKSAGGALNCCCACMRAAPADAKKDEKKDKDVVVAAADGEPSKEAPRADDTTEAVKQLLKYFVDKDAKAKEKEDADKKKKEFKRPTACFPGALEDYNARMDFYFMLAFFAVYVVGVALILRGPLPTTVIA